MEGETMTTHWTASSVDDFVHRLSFDFITQLAKRLESSPLNRVKLASALGVSKGRVSQILNNPSNLTLKRAVAYARALGMKVSVVAYDDGDHNNENGPVNSEIFSICWEKAGSPTDFQTAESLSPIGGMATTNEAVVVPERKGFVMTRRSARSGGQRTIYFDTCALLEIGDKSAATNESQHTSLAVGG
jgi:transcriptional regulator with XRE-family HTH domain